MRNKESRLGYAMHILDGFFVYGPFGPVVSFVPFGEAAL